jgi:hypothetical protein
MTAPTVNSPLVSRWRRPRAERTSSAVRNLEPVDNDNAKDEESNKAAWKQVRDSMVKSKEVYNRKKIEHLQDQKPLVRVSRSGCTLNMDNVSVRNVRSVVSEDGDGSTDGDAASWGRVFHPIEPNGDKNHLKRQLGNKKNKATSPIDQRSLAPIDLNAVQSLSFDPPSSTSTNNACWGDLGSIQKFQESNSSMLDSCCLDDTNLVTSTSIDCDNRHRQVKLDNSSSTQNLEPPKPKSPRKQKTSRSSRRSPRKSSPKKNKPCIISSEDSPMSPRWGNLGSMRELQQGQASSTLEDKTASPSSGRNTSLPIHGNGSHGKMQLSGTFSADPKNKSILLGVGESNREDLFEVASTNPVQTGYDASWLQQLLSDDLFKHDHKNGGDGLYNILPSNDGEGSFLNSLTKP